jgi:hypothetical protein
MSHENRDALARGCKYHLGHEVALTLHNGKTERGRILSMQLNGTPDRYARTDPVTVVLDGDRAIALSRIAEVEGVTRERATPSFASVVEVTKTDGREIL